MTAQSRHPSGDQGFTLIEVMVAVAIFSLLMTVLTATIVQGMQMSRSMGIRLDNINQGQLGMNAVTKALRTAVLPDQLVDSFCTGCGDTALIQATTTGVTFYANLNNTGLGPSKMSYYVEHDISNPSNSFGNLIQTTQAPTVISDGRYTFCDPAVTGCQVTKRVIARGLPWPSLPAPAAPTFGYYDFDGQPLDSTGPLDAEHLALVNSIDITLAIQTNTVQSKNAPTNTIVQRVALPNSNINVLVQP